MVQIHCDLVLAAVGPIGFRDREVWLGSAGGQVRWKIDLEAQFLGVLGGTV